MTGSVKQNRSLAQNIWEMEIHAPETVRNYQGAGQFVNILPQPSWDHPLRRPMSIASVANDSFTIIYKVMGRQTQLMSTFQPGNNLKILGPLGNTFSFPAEGEIPILVGGGVGLAPVLNYRGELQRRNVFPILILGARTAAEHFLAHQPDEQVYLTTDDGSMGITGTVIPTMITKARKYSRARIYACGPEPMLKAVQLAAEKHQLTAELSVESYMGCGVGLCQGCVIRSKEQATTEHSYHKTYSLVCTDGPVYEATEVCFD